MLKPTLLAAMFAVAFSPVSSMANKIEDLSREEVAIPKEPVREVIKTSSSAPILPAAPESPAYVVGIYGSDPASLTAELVDQHQYITAKAGTILPSGYAVKSISKSGVLLEKSVTKRKKTTVTERQLLLSTPLAKAPQSSTNPTPVGSAALAPLPVAVN